MVFSSTIFLFAFLPFVLLAVFPLRRAWQNAALLGLSVVFYIWGAGGDVVFILFVASISWGMAMVIPRLTGRARLIGQISALAVVLSPLLWVKYVPVIQGWADPDSVVLFALPLGISFFTFHAVSYIVDVYRGDLKPEKRVDHYFLYLFLFPHQIAGPIVRYSEIRDEIKARLRPRTEDVLYGLSRFGWGLAKKCVIADSAGRVADAVWAGADQGDLSTASAWIGAMAFTTQIYFDFSGYSDMAIGLARVFGFHFPENFAGPYRSPSATEFWRRWHMTLSRWFRDYVYIPLGGSRHGPLREYIALLITFALTSLWHGATFPFLIWGGLWSTALVIERVTGLRKARRAYVLRRVIMGVFIVFSWVAFRSATVDETTQIWTSMFTWVGGAPDPTVMLALTPITLVGLALGLVMFLLPGRTAWRCFDRIAGDPAVTAGRPVVTALVGLTALILGVMFAMWSSFSPFLYFQF